MADWILQQTGTRAEAVSVAIEVPHGPVVEFLMGRCFVVYAINPRQVDRFRDRFSPAGAKDDRRDARVLADAIRTDGDRWQRLEPIDSELIQLREFSRRGAQLTRDRTRLLNRLRQQLWRYYPQFLHLSKDLAEPWVMAVWKLAPTPDAARKLRPSRVAKVLKHHRIRRIDAPEVLRRLRVRSIPVAPGTTQAIVAHIESLGAHLALVQSQLRDISRELDRLIRAWEKRCESTPGPQGPSRDVAILASLPGVGRIVLATLLSEAFDPLRRRDYAALRCLCGVAPVTRSSGKYTLVVRRRAVHPRLREATYHWARVAVQHDPISRRKYDALRERGHGHARALRSVADRLLAVACAMLRDQTLFDPNHARQRRAA
jgi:transposase